MMGKIYGHEPQDVCRVPFCEECLANIKEVAEQGRKGLAEAIQTTERTPDLSVNTDDCWLWAGWGGASGHGKIYVGWKDGKSETVQAYRAVYEYLVGEIPEGMELDHLCENPVCINPDHLEPVTHRENTLRHYRNRTHCRNGHAYEEHGRIIYKKSNISKANPTGESRSCLLCH
jgi:hypothetical protein